MIDLVPQLDEFWRDALRNGVGSEQEFLKRYDDFTKRLQKQVSHLPQAQQDASFMSVVLRNAEYISIAGADRDALRVRLGVPV